MKTLAINFGTSLEEIKAIALKKFGTLENVYVSTFRNHYRGNTVGEIFAIEKEYPYSFHWHVDFEDRGVMRAYLIFGDVNELLVERKKMTDAIKNVIQPIHRFERKFINIDGRWSKSRKEEAFKSNSLFRAEMNQATEDFYKEVDSLSKDLQKSVYNLVSSRQFFIK